jgi:hypothetical protein
MALAMMFAGKLATQHSTGRRELIPARKAYRRAALIFAIIGGILIVWRLIFLQVTFEVASRAHFLMEQ